MKVLVVDNTPTKRDMFAIALDLDGHESVLADGYEQVVQLGAGALLKEVRLAAVDHNLGTHSGNAVVEKLRELMVDDLVDRSCQIVCISDDKPLADPTIAWFQDPVALAEHATSLMEQP